MKKKIVLRTVFCALLSIGNLTLSSESPNTKSRSSSVSYEGTSGSGSSSRSRSVSPNNTSDILQDQSFRDRSRLVDSEEKSQPGLSQRGRSPEGSLTKNRFSEGSPEKAPLVHTLSGISTTKPGEMRNVLRGTLVDITPTNKENTIYELVVFSPNGQMTTINMHSQYQQIDKSRFSIAEVNYVTYVNNKESGTPDALIIDRIDPQALSKLPEAPNCPKLEPTIRSVAKINLGNNNKNRIEPSSSYQRFFTPVLVGSIALIASILALYQLDRLPDSISQMPQNIMKFINNLRPTHLTQK